MILAVAFSAAKREPPGFLFGLFARAFGDAQLIASVSDTIPIENQQERVLRISHPRTYPLGAESSTRGGKIRRLFEPERPAMEHVESAALEEYRAELARRAAIISTHADAAGIRQAFSPGR